MSLGAFVLALVASLSPPVQRLEHTCLDLAYRYTGAPSRPSQDVVLLVIDSKSLLAMRSIFKGSLEGREEPWPWHRLFFGAVADFLRQAGAKAVAFDLDLSGTTQVDYCDEDTEPAAKALESSGIAYLGLNFKSLTVEESALDDLDQSADVLARSALEVAEEARLSFEEDRHDSVQIPYGPLSRAATARRLGCVNAVLDPGGALRRAPLLLRFQGKLFPSLALAVYLDLRGVKRIGVTREGRLALDGLSVPLDPDGRFLINWYGPERTFPSYSIHHTIRVALADYERRCPPPDCKDKLFWNDMKFLAQYSAEEIAAHAALFKGKTVFVGANASELGDVWSNPFCEAFPGVESHATVLSNLLDGAFLERCPRTVRWMILLAMSVAAGLGAAAVRGEKKGVLLYAVLVAVYCGLFCLVFERYLLWLDLVTPLLGASTAYGAVTIEQYLTVGRMKRQLRHTFDRVLQPALIDLLIQEPRRLELGGETRSLTVLFSDLQNFTALAERLPAQQLVKSINGYFSEFSGVILQRGAYLDKYIGDAVMAFWGAPVPGERHAAAACEAALELRERLSRLRWDGLREDEKPPLTRMGIHSGEMVVGMVGSEGAAHYTVMGDNVVVASRLEAANKIYGTQILVGEECKIQAGDGIVFREIDLLVLKGRSKPLRVHEPVCTRDALEKDDEERLKLFAEALALYRSRRWKEAGDAFHEALHMDPDDSPARVFLARCEAHREKEPPPEWAGEFHMREK